MPYLSDQVEYYNKKNSAEAQYLTIEFFADDIEPIRLVANQTFDKQFYVDGQLKTFKGVSMSLPAVTNQESLSSKAGTVNFGRIANELIPILKGRDPLDSLNPIFATQRNYIESKPEPIYTRTTNVASNGISMDKDNVSIKLAVDNPAKISLPVKFYDPSVFIGLSLL